MSSQGRDPAPQQAAFTALTPERILDAVEAGGRRATGYVLTLNSLENRVYEVELEDESRLVAKFYRPGRWSEAAIGDEHRFLAALADAELPVVSPLPLAGGTTLGTVPHEGGSLYFALFPKVRGRPPEELDLAGWQQLGRLVARLHHVGERFEAAARPVLTPLSYGQASLDLLVGSGPLDGVVPPELRGRFAAAGQAIVERCLADWPQAAPLCLHGDCHLGNLLVGKEGFFFLDFDDFLYGPAVQDLWLLAPGRDEEADAARLALVAGYESMRAFDRRTLRLVEPLRALRMLRYSAWIAQRWYDPAFRRAFPDWDTTTSWQRELAELEAQRLRVAAALL